MEELAEGLYKIPAVKPGCHSYLFRGEDLDVLVDPGVRENGERLKEVLERTPDIVINTHEHYDHIGANKLFQGHSTVAAHRYSAVKMINGDDAVLQCRAHAQDVSGYKVHLWLQNNNLVDIGGQHLKILHTPGHTSGCICIYESKQGILISGDTVFAQGTISEIKESGSYGEYMNSLERLNRLKIDLICPGHGELSDQPEETLEACIEEAKRRMEGNRPTPAV